MKYLEDKNLLANNQYGFRAGRSTEDAVLKLSSLITKYLDSGERCIGVFLDLQKAFDTVSIPIMLARLRNIGIRGTPLNWFQDYLMNRCQQVRVDGHFSDHANCLYGLPQGSAVSTSLFLIYINELCKMELTGAEVIMFADDTAIVFHGATWESTKRLVENGLRKVTSWLENSLLSINTAKTKYLCFSITNMLSPAAQFEITIHTYPCNVGDGNESLQCECAKLERSATIKYLGVVVDDKLKWSAHISSLAARIRKAIYMFRILRDMADLKLLITIYKALCESVISYCISSWGGAAKTSLLELERAQRAVIKVILKLPFKYPTTSVYKKADVLSVRRLYVYQCVKRYHRITVPTLPVTQKRIDTCPVPRVKTKFAQRYYDVLAPRLYNCINSAQDIKACSNYSIKNILTHWLKSFDYEGIENLLTIIE